MIKNQVMEAVLMRTLPLLSVQMTQPTLTNLPARPILQIQVQDQRRLTALQQANQEVHNKAAWEEALLNHRVIQTAGVMTTKKNKVTMMKLQAHEPALNKIVQPK